MISSITSFGKNGDKNTKENSNHPDSAEKQIGPLQAPLEQFSESMMEQARGKHRMILTTFVPATLLSTLPVRVYWIATIAVKEVLFYPHSKVRKLSHKKVKQLAPGYTARKGKYRTQTQAVWLSLRPWSSWDAAFWVYGTKMRVSIQGGGQILKLPSPRNERRTPVNLPWELEDGAIPMSEGRNELSVRRGT